MSVSETAIPAGMARQVWQHLQPYAGCPMVVAFSGGVDSTVLLHLLVTLRDLGLIYHLSAVHVHHGLSANADAWADHCRQLCTRWQVPAHIEHVVVARGDSLEQAARSERYQVFERFLPEAGCLLQGHHQDDQAETLLFRLFRGTGVDGLAGIPGQRSLGKGILLRPLLSSTRADIVAYASQHQLDHIEDESNQDQRFARNYLRHHLLPEIEQRWPGVSERLARLAEDAGTTRQLIRQAVEDAARGVLAEAPLYWNAGKVIRIDALLQLSSHMALKVVRFWLAEQGLTMPDRQQLALIFAEVIHCREDAEPLLQLGACEVRRFNGFLVLVPAAPPWQGKGLIWDARRQPDLLIPGCGRLSLEGDWNDYPGELKFELAFRSGLEPSGKVRTAGRSGRKTVKRWLQDYRVPPWLRERVPFLFQSGKMLAAAGIWTCAEAGDNPLDINSTGLRVVWRFCPGDSQ